MITNITVQNSHLTALTSLISSSVQEVIAAHASVGTTVPSLDSVEPGPFDGPVEDVPERLVRAIRLVEAACAQLVSTVSIPKLHLVNVRQTSFAFLLTWHGLLIRLQKANAHAEPSCLLVVTDAKIPDLLVGRPEGVHVDQLAAESSFKDADKLGRVMRLLAARHVFREGTSNENERV
jgi:hypothetical protein